jgi:CHASE3 domain sensor protein
MKITKKQLTRIIKEELDASLPSGGDPVKQEYDALTTMISRLDGMESFLLMRERSFFDTHQNEIDDLTTKMEECRDILSGLRKDLK